MLFKQTTFVVSTKAREDVLTGTNTTIVLTEHEVADSIVLAALVSGQSPRVAYQNRWRKNGIPKDVKMSWAEWIGRPPSIVAPQVMSPEEILAAALANPEILAKLREQLEKGEQT